MRNRNVARTVFCNRVRRDERLTTLSADRAVDAIDPRRRLEDLLTMNPSGNEGADIMLAFQNAGGVGLIFAVR